MIITLPDAVLLAIQKLNCGGYEAFVVGGCVRDSLLSKTPLDWDIATSATPSEMQAVFASFRTVETGLQHGTLTVLIDDMPLEITTYRIDGNYLDGRHPDSVLFTHSLEQDLQRRDFTINAMAYHPDVGIIDPYDGQSDLAAGLLRCVGPAEQRISEDALRILRALRFASVLGLAIDEKIDAAVRILSPTLHYVAPERIATELCKLLCGQNASRIVAEYADILREIIPEITDTTELCLLDMVPAEPIVRWSALFYATNLPPQTATLVLRRLRMDTHTIHRVEMLLSCKNWPMSSDADFLRLLNRLDKAWIFDYLALRKATTSNEETVRRLLRDKVCYHISMLALDGNDVISAGIPAGPSVGTTLHTLLDAVIDGKCANNKADLLKFIQNTEQPVP